MNKLGLILFLDKRIDKRNFFSTEKGNIFQVETGRSRMELKMEQDWWCFNHPWHFDFWWINQILEQTKHFYFSYFEIYKSLLTTKIRPCPGFSKILCPCLPFRFLLLSAPVSCDFDIFRIRADENCHHRSPDHRLGPIRCTLESVSALVQSHSPWTDIVRFNDQKNDLWYLWTWVWSR